MKITLTARCLHYIENSPTPVNAVLLAQAMGKYVDAAQAARSMDRMTRGGRLCHSVDVGRRLVFTEVLSKLYRTGRVKRVGHGLYAAKKSYKRIA